MDQHRDVSDVLGLRGILRRVSVLAGLVLAALLTVSSWATTTLAQAVPTGSVTYEPGSLIIPMDADTTGNHSAYNQNLGMWKAYGLVYRLLSNGVPVHWAQDPTKTSANTVDFRGSSVEDLRTGTDLNGWDYRGGPFVIAAADAARATPIIQGWWAQQANLPNVHRAKASFTAPVPMTLRSAPRIANESTNAGIAIAYYNTAGIPDLNGKAWSSLSPNLLTQEQIAAGGLFENGSKCLRRRFDTFVTPHNGGYSYSLTDATNLGTKTYAQLDTFVHEGGGWTAMCHSILSNENAFAALTNNGSPAVKALFATSRPGGQPGGLLTRFGFPSITNGGGTWALRSESAKLPVAQMVPTSVAPVLPGGSVQTWPASGTGAPTYFSQTERVASFTSGSVVSDQIIAGSYHNGTGAGKATYIGGHSYSTAVPYTTNTEGPYLKAFYNSLFFNGIANARMDLVPSRTTFAQGASGTLQLRLTNVGGSSATAVQNASITLEPGFTYVDTVTGPQPTVSGQTLTWSDLGDIDAGDSAVEIKVSVDSSVTSSLGKTRVAAFQANYGDVFGEGFTANACQEITIAAQPAPVLTKTPATQDGPFQPGDKVTWTLTYGNSGAADLTNAVVNDTLPAGFTYVSSSSSPTLSAPTVIPGSRTQVRWNIGTIKASTPNAGTITLVARAGTLSSPPTETVTNEARLTGTDAGGGELSASASAKVTLSQPELTLEKSVDKSYAAAGEIVTYSLLPQQTGSGSLSDLRVIDPVPSGITSTPTPGQGGTYGDYVPVAAVPGQDSDGTLTLDTSVAVDKTFANQGDTVTVTVSVKSTASASGVSPSLDTSGGAATCTGPSPASAALTANTAQAFTYTCTMADQGEITFSADASSGDGNTGWPVATSNSVLVAATGGPKVLSWNLGSTSPAVAGQTISSGYSAGVYQLRGAGTSVFRKYVTDSSSWVDKANSAAIGAGGALTNDGAGTVYALAGGGTQGFSSYSVTTNAWTSRAATGASVADGGSLVFLEVSGTKYVYALMGNGTGFRRHDVSTNSWDVRANLPANAKKGASLSTDGTYIYAVRGDRQKKLYRYDVAANKWDTMADAPNGIGVGSGSARIGNFIYVTRGDGKKDLYRYSISGNSWTTLVPAPANITTGGALTTDGTVLYALQGNSTVFEQYDPASNTWSKLAPTAGNTGAGGALTYMPGEALKGQFTSLTIDQSLATTDDTITASARFTDSSPAENVTPGTLKPVVTNGTACTILTGPTLTSADDDIAGDGDAVTYSWTCKATPGANPGSVKFTVDGSGSGSVVFPVATSNSAIVTPTLTFSAAIPAGAPDPVVNGAVVVAEDTSAPSALVNVNTGAPALAITKSNEPTSAATLRPGDAVTYTMRVENTGSAPATSVEVSDLLPAELTYASCTGGTSCSATGNNVTWRLGSLAPGDVTTLTVTGTVSSSLTVQATAYTLTNRATVDSAETSPVVSNPVTNSVEVKPTITKAVSVPTAGTGETLTYTITVTNPGVSFVTDITDTVPAGTTFTTGTCSPGCSLVDSVVKFASVTVPPGVSTYSFDVTVTAGGGSEVVNKAILSPTTSLKTESNEVVTEIGPSLEVVKTNAPSGKVAQGDTITYTLVVTNESAVPSTNTIVTDEVPTGTTFAGCEVPSGTCHEAEGLVNWHIGTIAGRATTTVSWTATVDTLPSGKFDIANRATVYSGNAPDERPSNYVYNVLDVPTLQLAKSASPTFFVAAGDVITYSYVVTNNSTSPITGPVQVSDDKTTVTCPAGNLPALGAVTCTATYTITTADVTAKSVTNTAQAQAGGQTSNTAKATVDIAHPTLRIAKTHADTFTQADTGRTYTLRVSNVGDVATAGTVSVTDSVPVGLTAKAMSGTGWTCSVLTCTRTDALAPGAHYPDITVTVDVDDDAPANVVNTAKVSGGGDPNSHEDEDSTVITPLRILTISKTHQGDLVQGETGTYTITVGNVGTESTDRQVSVTEIPPTGMTVSAMSGSGWTCTLGTLTCTRSDVLAPAASYPGITVTVTVAANAPASLTNVARVSGGGDTSTHEDDDPTVIDPADPGLSVVKTAAPTSFTSVGSPVTFTAVAKNTGNVTLRDVEIVDGNADVTGWTCQPAAPAVLAPGAEMTCSGQYVTNQADVDAGEATNSVTAKGKDPSGSLVSDEDTVEVPGPAALPSLSVVKSATPSAFTGAGQRIVFTAVATNTGNVTLHDVDIVEANLAVTDWTCDAVRLAPGEKATCSGDYVTSQADVDAGKTTNAVTAKGKDPSGTAVSDDDTIDVPGPAVDPGLSVVKSASPTSFTSVGARITFTAVATNTGNVTLRDVEVVESNPGVTGWSCQPAAPAVLAPGEEIACSGDYVSTQADVDAGKVVNTVTAKGTDPDGNPVSKDADVQVPGPSNSAALAVAKTAFPVAFSQRGEQITYTVTATNIGPVTLTDVRVEDLNPNVTGWSCRPTAPARLAPGEAVTCRGTYVTTQADMDAGKTTNAATASGKDPQDQPVQASGSVEVPGPKAAPGLSLVKTSAPDRFTAAGRTITYTLLAKNTGNVTLTDVVVSDADLGLSCAPVELAPGESTQCSGPYTTTQADVDRGFATNAASVEGKDRAGQPVSAEADLTVPGPDPVPGIAVVKSASPSAFTVVGQSIAFTIQATNTGNVTLSGVTVADPKLGSLSCNPGLPTSLAPGASVTCGGTYTTGQGDVTAGVLSNTATVSAKDPDNQTVSDQVTVVVPGPDPVRKLAVVKSASPAVFTKAGETITYQVQATNVGNVPLTNVVVTDPGLSLTCVPTTPAALQPGERVTCTGSYVTTQADVNAGQATNTASAKDTTAGLEETDTLVVPGPRPVPGVEVVKTSAPERFTSVGDKITYTVVATNTGNVTLTDVAVQDANPDVTDWTCQPGTATLKPNEAITCTGSYRATQGDVDRGSTVNSATANGEDPTGTVVRGRDSVDVPGPVQDPGLTLVKTSTPGSFSKVGESLTMTLVTTNSGNVTMSDVRVVDDSYVGGWTCSPETPSTLAPGEKVTCRGSYVTTQSDLDKGTVVNTARASGKDPLDQRRRQRTLIDVPGSPAPVSDKAADLSIVKTNNGPTVVSGKARFRLSVTNRGPDSAERVSLTDTLPAGLTYVSAQGDGWTCTNSAANITCDLAGVLASGTSSTVELVVKASVSARPAVRNTATVTSDTPDPDPANNTSGSTLQVTKLPQKAVKNNKVSKRPGQLVIRPGVTNADRTISTKVRCRPVKTSAAGEARFCKVTRKGNRIVVTARGDGRFKVLVLSYAKPTAKYRPYRDLKTYTVRGKR